ncbi:MAG: efflux RND transporter permease subunit [Opitutales bacterium]|nr:efflux RND transporter permease subunit [Opitutales bacterium]
MQPDNPSNGGLATLFFRNRHLLALATVITLVAGAAALESLPRLEDPVITQRNPIVLTAVPGASAERVEALVSKPIEDALAEIPEIKTLASTSRDGISVVNIELQDSVTRATNQAVFSRIREELRAVGPLLPPEARTPEFDEKRGAVAFTVLAAIRWEGDDEAVLPGLLKRHAEALADRLRNVPGTQLVRIYGAPEEEFRIDLDPAALAGMGLTAGDVTRIIREADTKSPAGVLYARESQIALEVEADLDAAERIGALPLRRDANGGIVHLRDIADIQRAWREPESELASADGKRAVFVAARVQPDQRVDRWSASAIAVVDAYRAEVGRGLGLDLVFDQNRYTTERLGELASSLLLGALVVVIVVLMTMGWRSALIVGSTLPLTAAATLFLLSAGGGSIQQMSIFGMIIAIGLLIDNAIVTTDEIRSRMAAGAEPLEAVGGAVRHLFIPLLSSSLTTMLAFAPILLLPGNAGDFVGSIGTSVVLAIGSSFFIAMTLIAAYSGTFGRSRHPATGSAWWRSGLHTPRLSRAFAGSLGAALRHPWLAVLACALIPLLGFFAATRTPLEFFPPTDRNMFSIRVWLPENASIAETERTLRAIETDLRARPEVERVHWIAGGSFPSVYYNLVMNVDNSPGFGRLIVVTRTARDVVPILTKIQDQYPSQFPAAQIVANAFGQGPPTDAEIEIRVIGQDLTALREAGALVRRLLAEDPRVQTTRTSIPDGSMKLWFVPDRPEIQLAGWSPLRIADELQSRLVGLPAGTALEDLEPMPLRVRLDSDARDTPEALRDQYLPAPTGEWIPLEALGRLEYRPAQGAVTRRDRERVNTIQGFTTAGTLPIQVTRETIDRLNHPDAPPLPAGVRIEVGGEAEGQSNAVGNLTLYVPVLVTLTLGILILSFRSVRVAAILCTAAFLSVGFGLLAVTTLGYPLSLNSILGSLGLVGLAFNASIVVVASIRANPVAAGGGIDGMVDAVMSCGRHLTSTTLTTIGGCLPLILLVGGDFWPPLAIVLVGGVGGSTLLALVFTPALYRRFAAVQP